MKKFSNTNFTLINNSEDFVDNVQDIHIFSKGYEDWAPCLIKHFCKKFNG